MKLLEFTMTGTAHSAGYKAHSRQIKDGDLLDLERDPHNPYDQHAIKILWEGTQIGWVPKKLCEAKAMLDALLAWETDVVGFVCKVAAHSPENPVDMQLQVQVDIEEAA